MSVDKDVCSYITELITNAAILLIMATNSKYAEAPSVQQEQCVCLSLFDKFGNNTHFAHEILKRAHVT